MVVTDSVPVATLDPSQVIHCVSSLLAIPLDPVRAALVVTSLASTQAQASSKSSSEGEPGDDPAQVESADESSEEDVSGTEPLTPPAQFSKSGRVLDDKIANELVRELVGMCFSYSFDITRSLQHKHDLAPLTDQPRSPTAEPLAHWPLWRRADTRFFYNRFLISDFIAQGVSPSSAASVPPGRVLT